MQQSTIDQLRNGIQEPITRSGGPRTMDERSRIPTYNKAGNKIYSKWEYHSESKKITDRLYCTQPSSKEIYGPCSSTLGLKRRSPDRVFRTADPRPSPDIWKFINVIPTPHMVHFWFVSFFNRPDDHFWNSLRDYFCTKREMPQFVVYKTMCFRVIKKSFRQ